MPARDLGARLAPWVSGSFKDLFDGPTTTGPDGQLVVWSTRQLADVAEILNISAAQAYALVRNGSLPAIKVGGRGQWRVEAAQLEAYIQRAYDETRAFVEAHPYGRPEDDVPAGELD